MRVSVVVPTFNAGSEITRLLEALRAQSRAPDQIIAIDSGSRDDTCQRARDGGATVVEWREPFNHGRTRDAGIAAATGDIVLLTVQDAVPASRDYVAKIAAHYADEKVAGVTTRQVPPPDGPLELQIKAELDAREDVQYARLSDHPGYHSYPAWQRLELYRFDNVCSSLRRSVWAEIPFGDCRYAEDYQWARRAIEAGHTLVRDPSAPMIHAHRRGFWYEFRRGLLDAWVLDEAFGFRYSFLKKLNRVKMLAGGGSSAPSFGARLGAMRTYSAHALARSCYWGYRTLMKPVGIGERTMRGLTKGI